MNSTIIAFKERAMDDPNLYDWTIESLTSLAALEEDALDDPEVKEMVLTIGREARAHGATECLLEVAFKGGVHTAIRETIRTLWENL